MLISALQAVQGKPNSLGISSRNSVCVILIDGLGFHNLVEAAGHARYLNGLNIDKSYCFFPSTTSTSLTSLATTKPPAATGFIGYNIYDRTTKKRMNLLSGWHDQESATKFQTLPTISELAVASGVAFDVVSHATYENTGLTAATMPSATFHSANSIEERFAVAAELMKQDDQRVIYLYVQELDQMAHAVGSNSYQWLAELEALDALVKNFAFEIPKGAGAILTSDHGVIDVTEFEKIFLDELLPEDEMLFVGGDTRGLMIYLRDATTASRYMESLESSLGEFCYVVTAEQLVTAGWVADVQQRTEIVPDFWLLAKRNVALYHRSFARPKSIFNVGHHGSISDRELAIPIIRLNC